MTKESQPDTASLFMQDDSTTSPKTPKPDDRYRRQIGPYSIWNKPTTSVNPGQATPNPANDRNEMKKARRQKLSSSSQP